MTYSTLPRAPSVKSRPLEAENDEKPVPAPVARQSSLRPAGTATP